MSRYGRMDTAKPTPRSLEAEIRGQTGDERVEEGQTWNRWSFGRNIAKAGGGHGEKPGAVRD